MFVDVLGAALVQDAALTDDQDPVGEAEDLLDLAGDHDDGDALVGETADERVDLGPGTDVDAVAAQVAPLLPLDAPVTHLSLKAQRDRTWSLPLLARLGGD